MKCLYVCVCVCVYIYIYIRGACSVMVIIKWTQQTQVQILEEVVYISLTVNNIWKGIHQYFIRVVLMV